MRVPHGRGALVATASVILAAVWMSTPQPVHACVCSGRSVEEYAADADVIFSGTVVEHIYPVLGQEDLPDVHRFEVDSVWKGSLAPVVDVSGYRDDCDFIFSAGHRYLVFALQSHDGGIKTRQCTGTTEWGVFSYEDRVSGRPSDFMNALAYLGESHPPDTKAAVATLVPTPWPLTMATVEVWQTATAAASRSITLTAPPPAHAPTASATTDSVSSAEERKARVVLLTISLVAAVSATLFFALRRVPGRE